MGKKLNMSDGVTKRITSVEYLGILIDETSFFKQHVTLTS
jgi:hypothetical protein